LTVAGATLSAVAAACFQIQAMALVRVGRNDLIAVHVVTQLELYHNSSARMTIDGGHLTAVCGDVWRRRRHVETVSLDNGRALVQIGNKLSQRSRWALDAFELAGCPRTLASWLGTRLNEGERITLSLTMVRAEHVYALRVPGAHFGLELFIPRPGGLPIELAISGGGIRGTSEVKYGLLPPPLTGLNAMRPLASWGNARSFSSLSTGGSLGRRCNWGYFGYVL
jgi:hypothetical protein